jgi:hypothetical protein
MSTDINDTRTGNTVGHDANGNWYSDEAGHAQAELIANSSPDDLDEDDGEEFGEGDEELNNGELNNRTVEPVASDGVASEGAVTDIASIDEGREGYVDGPVADGELTNDNWAGETAASDGVESDGGVTDIASIDEGREGYVDSGLVDEEPVRSGELLNPNPGYPGDTDVSEVSDVAEVPDISEYESPLSDVEPADGIVASAEAEPAEVISDPDLSRQPLLDAEVENGFLSRWTEIQISFVEDPGQSVRAADALVQEISAALVSAFQSRRGDLAATWEDGSSDTEQLRLALWQYRSFIGVILPK